MRPAGKLTAQGALLAAGLLAALVGCLLDLPSVCGDGVVDVDGGEQCDPAAADEPRCDPVRCTLLAAPGCGNGKIDATGEQCDLSDFGLKDCPSGKGFLSCTDDCKLDDSTCDQCGDGEIDVAVGEECDPKFDYMGFKQPQDCSELETFPDKPYTSGQTVACDRDTCQWYRGPCGFCGDDEADEARVLDNNNLELRSVREVCDGEDVHPTDLADHCEQRGCGGLACAVDCLETCDGFVEEDEVRCCLPAGSNCPSAGQAPCCYAYDHDLADLHAAEACQIVAVDDDAGIKHICK